MSIPHDALRELLKTNSKVNLFRDTLQKPTTKLYYLNMLQNGEVSSCDQKLNEKLRCVVKKQCSTVNVKLMALKEIINQTQAPLDVTVLLIWGLSGKFEQKLFHKDEKESRHSKKTLQRL